ncbi:hypothetical protein IC607_09245 [Cellulomonas sp. JH27-2]|uniref:hypothetical protein n=1 Tax=Cellulomonas sp. JH27-2 TaxID=2774139 RepID=UPI00177C0D58|nr:hypothetical protein [Cellulomonas sp. JH27-2]MBD8059150.1 hypothetical protein [Cellulomonas sp. JH27-2]
MTRTRAVLTTAGVALYLSGLLVPEPPEGFTRTGMCLVLGATAVVIVVPIYAWVWVITTRLGRGVRAARPDAAITAGWADAGLGPALRSMGIKEMFRRSGGTHVVLTWDDLGVEVWRGSGSGTPRRVVGVLWKKVESISVGEGCAGTPPRPAVVVAIARGPMLIVVPARARAGGVFPASLRQVQKLVDELGVAARPERAARPGG